jgi:ABC-type glycerol-3-phosphate transport system substrate-binding protein
VAILLVVALAVNIVLSNISANSFATSSLPQSSPVQSHKNEKITINAIFAEPKDRWDMLVKDALDELRQRKISQVDIQINYIALPYNVSREQMLKALSSNESNIDLISVDQIWASLLREAFWQT